MPDDNLARVSYERRAAERFPMERQVRYKVTGRKGACQEGAGTTINMSSRGVLFTTDAPVPPGRRIEVSINWPAQLNETCALRFVAHGRVVRSDDSTAAIEIGRYEFRTRRAQRESGPIPIA